MKHTCKECEAYQRKAVDDAYASTMAMLSFWSRVAEIIPWIVVFYLGLMLGVLIR
jgi:hypothetical protein